MSDGTVDPSLQRAIDALAVPGLLIGAAPGLADYVVVVHGYAKRLCHLDDRLRHLDVDA